MSNKIIYTTDISNCNSFTSCNSNVLNIDKANFSTEKSNYE